MTDDRISEVRNWYRGGMGVLEYRDDFELRDLIHIDSDMADEMLGWIEHYKRELAALKGSRPSGHTITLTTYGSWTAEHPWECTPSKCTISFDNVVEHLVCDNWSSGRTFAQQADGSWNPC